jgi:DNA-binding transcriptional ArsR family regulator
LINHLEQSKALANEARLSILLWLAEPDVHFPNQVVGRPSELGVCVTFFAEKLELAQPTVSKHLDVLRRAGFVKVAKLGRWSYFSREEAAIADYKQWINESL